MAYVEYLRVRKSLYIFGGILTAMIVFVLVSLLSVQNADGATHFRFQLGNAIVLEKGHDGKLHQVSLSGMPGLAIPIGALFGMAAYCAMVFATVVCTSLNKERDGLDFPLTHPISRVRFALSYFAVDAAGICAAFVIGLVVLCFVPLAAAGVLGRIVLDSGGLWIAVLGLGIAFMWFGVLQAATASLRFSGGLMAGLSWAFFVVLLFLPRATILGPLVHELVLVLNLVNPLAYFSDITGLRNNVTVGSIFALSVATRAAIVWAIALAAGAIAILTWKRLEV